MCNLTKRENEKEIWLGKLKGNTYTQRLAMRLQHAYQVKHKHFAIPQEDILMGKLCKGVCFAAGLNDEYVRILNRQNDEPKISSTGQQTTKMNRNRQSTGDTNNVKRYTAFAVFKPLAVS